MLRRIVLIACALCGTSAAVAQGPVVHAVAAPQAAVEFRLSDADDDFSIQSLEGVEIELEEPDTSVPFPMTEADRRYLEQLSEEGEVVPRSIHIDDPLIEAGEYSPGTEYLGCQDCGVKPETHDRWIERPGDRDRGDYPPHRYRIDPLRRAGNPYAVAPWAKYSITKLYEACWVGGGLPIGGRGRTCQEGTWGLDYAGLLPRKIWLRWGAPYQGGTEGYATDHEPLLE